MNRGDCPVERERVVENRLKFHRDYDHGLEKSSQSTTKQVLSEGKIDGGEQFHTLSRQKNVKLL